MRRSINLAAVLIFLYVSAYGAADPCSDVPKLLAEAVSQDRLKQLFTDFGIDPRTDHLYFVAIDHRHPGQMQAYDWTTSGDKSLIISDTKSDDFKVKLMHRGDDGLAELPLPRRSRVITVLTHTNPALYSLSKSTTFVPLPGLEDMTKILNGLGQFVSASAGRKPAFATLASTNDIDELEKARTEALNVAKAVDTDRSYAVRFLQYSEEGAVAAAKPTPYPNTSTDAAKVSTVFENLRKKREEFATGSEAIYGCKDLTDIAKLARTALETPGTAPAALAKLRLSITGTTCSPIGKEKLLQLLHSSGDGTGPAANPEIAGSLNPVAPAMTHTNTSGAATEDPRKIALDTFIAISEGVMSLAKAADDMLATELAVLKTAVEIRTLASAPHAFESCAYTKGILFADTPDQVAFDKLGTVKLTIAEVAPLGATYHRRAGATGDRSFRIANPTAKNISIGVGAIYTPLRESTYKAVTNPFDATQKVIAKTDEKKRAGAVALLGTYRWGKDPDLFRPGVQLGVGFGTDPQVFAGLSVDIGPLLRIGLGVTGQQVTGLAGGQTPLAFGPDGKPLTGASVVKTDDDIRRKVRLVGAPYFSLTFSLDSLSLFKHP
jgi:hypothetical protein